jgi:hypothetical protein
MNFGGTAFVFTVTKNILTNSKRNNYMKKFKVFYCKNPKFRTNPAISRDLIGNEYIHVRDIEVKDRSDIYFQMQGEVWSPNGEARELIKSKGLQHTSMCVGDVVFDIEENKYYEVDRVGYKEF